MQDVEVEVEGENKPMKKRSYTRGKSFSLDKDIGTMHYDGQIIDTRDKDRYVDRRIDVG
jgi:hypothetical protein